MNRKWCIYVTENLDSGNYYFGKTYVENVKSGYNGSGSYIKSASGAGCDLQTTILNTYNSEEKAYLAEEACISVFINKDNCKNICDSARPPTFYGGDHHSARSVIDLSTGRIYESIVELESDINVSHIAGYLRLGCDVDGRDVAYLDEYIDGTHSSNKRGRREKARKRLLMRRRESGVMPTNKDRDRAAKIKYLLTYTSMTGSEISKSFNVYPSLVSKIKNEKRWKDIRV